MKISIGEVTAAMNELPFVLSGEYSPSCNCNHCVDMPKTIDTLLAVASAYVSGTIGEMASEEDILERLDFAYHNGEIPDNLDDEDLQRIAKALSGKLARPVERGI